MDLSLDDIAVLYDSVGAKVFRAALRDLGGVELAPSRRLTGASQPHGTMHAINWRGSERE